MLDLSEARRVLWSLLAGASFVACEPSAEVAIDPSPHDEHQRSGAPGASSHAPPDPASADLPQPVQSSAGGAHSVARPPEAPSRAGGPSHAPTVAARAVAPGPSAVPAAERPQPQKSAAPHGAGAEHACGEGKCGG